MSKPNDGGVGRVAGAGVTPAPVPAAAPAAATNTPGKALRDKGSWRILVDTMYPADDDQLARILKGDKIPHSERKIREAKAGTIVTDYPAGSVARDVASGHICKADGPDDPYRKGSEGGGE